MKNQNFRICHFIIGIMALVVITAIPDCSNAAPGTSRISMGAVATYAQYDILDAGDGAGNIEESHSIGGGLVFENLFTNHIGIHTGFLFGWGIFIYDHDQEATSSWVSLPLYALFEFQSTGGTIGFLAGLSFYHMFEIEYRDKNTGYNSDVSNFVNNDQVTFDAGLEIKIPVSDFVDLFFGIVGRLAITTFSTFPGDQTDRLYGFSFMSGALFRTF